MGRLQLHPTLAPAPSPISRQQRIQLIRRLHDGDGMDRTERVIGLLILLYAQPLPRIVRLTIDDIISPDDSNDAGDNSDHVAGMSIRLGSPPAPVPAPFDQVIRDYFTARPNLTTATNPGSRWLFPCRRAGQPLHPTSIRLRLQRLGIPNLNSRSRALREMLVAPDRVSRGRCRPAERLAQRSRLGVPPGGLEPELRRRGRGR